MHRSIVPSRRRGVVRLLAGIGAVIVLGLTVGAAASTSDSPTAARSPSAVTQPVRPSTGGGASTQGIARW